MLSLGKLGKITSAQLQLADLQQSNDQATTQITRLKAQIAELKRELAAPSLSAAERISLRDQISQAEQQLTPLEDQLAQNAQDARYATLTLTMQTPLLKHKQVTPVHHGRAHRVLAKSVEILAWEAVAVFYALVVLVPLAAVSFLLYLLLRRWRRRADERLLEDA
jgi:predicted RNase H-like nuclease (RuvC/YqgF family)